VIKNNVTSTFDYLHKGSAKANLEKTLASEKKENQYLKEKLNLVKTDKFVAEEAQNKLGLLREGEFFVIAPTAAPLEGERIEVDSKANWQKWLELFL
jgi:cell division protein FtsB